MSGYTKDILFALRGFRRNPGFTAIAVLVIALGIGVTTAIFSLVDATALRPLPYRQSEQLVSIGQGQLRGQPGDATASRRQFAEWQQHIRTVREMASYDDVRFVLGEGEAVLVDGLSVSTNLFSLLGVMPSLGRGFLPEEAQAGRGQVVVVSDSFWRRRLGGEASAIGQSVVLDGRSHLIVGVAPPTFHFPPGEANIELWVPASAVEDPAAAGRHDLKVVGRLAEGVSLATSQAELEAIQARLPRRDAVYEMGRTLTAASLKAELVREARPTMITLLVAAGFVLLIVCANVANLLLVRATAREGEIAVRRALGAGRGRVVRMLLLESLLLALLGGALGVGLAVLSLDALVTLLPEQLPRAHAVAINGRVLLFAFGLAVTTGLAFGVFPALTGSSFNLDARLRRSSRTVGRGRGRALLLISEIALAFVLSTGAALTVRSFARLTAVDPGFDARNVVAVPLALVDGRPRPPGETRALYAQLLPAVRQRLGNAVAISTAPLPFAGGTMTHSYRMVGNGGGEEPLLKTPARYVSPGYFELMGIRLLRGRLFAASDDVEGAAPMAIVSDSFVRQRWPGEDAIDKRVNVGGQIFQIVGVVADTKARLDRAGVPEMYLPFAQLPLPSFVVLARSADKEGVVAAVRQELRRLAPGQPLAEAKTMEQLMRASVAQRRLTALALGLFGALALCLAAVGIYGVMSYTVAQRTAEFGLRIAVGATPVKVVRWVLAHSLRLAAIGVAIGVAGALALGRVLNAQLYGITATDTGTFLAVGSVVLLTAAIAALRPALRATRVPPMVAFRGE
jgi:putative ABC transport system permease protein